MQVSANALRSHVRDGKVVAVAKREFSLPVDAECGALGDRSEHQRDVGLEIAHRRPRALVRERTEARSYSLVRSMNFAE